MLWVKMRHWRSLLPGTTAKTLKQVIRGKPPTTMPKFKTAVGNAHHILFKGVISGSNLVS